MSEVTTAAIVATSITVFGIKTGIDPLALFAGLTGALWSLTTISVTWYVRPFAVFLASICSAWASAIAISAFATIWRKWFGSELDTLSAQALIAFTVGYLFLSTLPKLPSLVDRGLVKAVPKE